MILRYYGLPNLNPAANYQCGVVGSYYFIVGGLTHPCVSNCALCVNTIGSLTELQRVINDYGNVAQFVGIQSRVLRSTALFAFLSLSQLAKELDEGRPVLAGISFRGISLPNISQHAILLIGYNATGSIPTVDVNDPFPYNLYFPQQNPYLVSGGLLLQPGRYRIAYQTLVTDFVWANTLYNIR